jgi:hypothetical protein
MLPPDRRGKNTMQPVPNFSSGVQSRAQPPAASSGFYNYQPSPSQPMQSGDWENKGSWSDGGQTSSYGGADAVSGHMSGPMSSAAPTQGTPSIARSISASLLGEGDADEPPILEGMRHATEERPVHAATSPALPTQPSPRARPLASPPKPLCAELGINFEHILQKTKIVLWPRRSTLTSSSPIVQDDDFAGPLLFCLALATLLLFKGKVQFNTIYGVFAVGLVGLCTIFNLMSQNGIAVLRTASVMGYCLLPIVILAAVSIPIEMRGLVGAIAIPLAVIWSANAASVFFVAALDAYDRRWLLAYPVALFYTCFALITIF